MRIYISDESGKKWKFGIPLGLAFNGVTAGFIAKKGQKEGTNISKKQMRALMKEVKNYKKDHEAWKLVEIDSADGVHVEITL